MISGSLGQKCVGANRLQHNHLPAPAEYRLGCAAVQNDSLLLIHRDDGVHGRVQHARQERFRLVRVAAPRIEAVDE